MAAYASLQRANDASHRFDQEANFWYLTGINAPDWQVAIDGTSGRSWLIAPDVSEVHKIFDGGLDWAEAKLISGVDEVVSRNDGDMLLRDLTKKHRLAYSIGKDPYAQHYDFALNPSLQENWRRLERLFTEVRDCRKELAALRSIKQPEEIKAIKQAVRLTVGAFEYVRAHMSSYKHEYEIEADFSHYFRSRGAVGHAYDPIIASARNACTLHYNTNQAKLAHNKLVLMDVGARVSGYAADISRTYIHGTATKRQQAVMRAVQTAHREIINLLGPNISLEDYLANADAIMKQALISLKLMKSENDTEAYRHYFPHAVSHGLGIDVHDSLGAPRLFSPGMVLTVEPGIYIPEEGIGVRIEDDILITDRGYDNLSKALSTEH